jgi:hypothetical protein
LIHISEEDRAVHEMTDVKVVEVIAIDRGKLTMLSFVDSAAAKVVKMAVARDEGQYSSQRH